MQFKDGPSAPAGAAEKVIVPAMNPVPASYRSTSGWLLQGYMQASGWVFARLISSPDVTMDQRLFRPLKSLQWIQGRRSYFEKRTNL